MKEGIVMKPHIVKRFSEKTGHKITKCGFLISEKCPFLGASPDGITEEGNIIEVKQLACRISVAPYLAIQYTRGIILIS